jgi:two-component system KDP operon response regulator KdpE
MVPPPVLVAVDQPRDPRAADVGAPRVLVVDEEPQIVRGLSIILRSAGYTVEAVDSWYEAPARVAASRPDALVLDLVQPDGQGVELCREVRRSSRLPILVLAAASDERQKVRALDAGADDFVTGPFATDELLTRLRALLRPPGKAEGNTPLEIGELVIDLAHRRVTRAGAVVQLTPVEFELVHLLARHRERLVTDRRLLRAVRGFESVAETHNLRIQLAHIRSKLERDPSRPEYLITEPGIGYRLRDPARSTKISTSTPGCVAAS